MNLYNNSISKKINDAIRSSLILPSLRRRLQNYDFTIISNNCTGGFVYHDLGVRFNSPTINLSFASDEDFFSFAEDIPYYLSCELVDITAKKVNRGGYPVATLGNDSNHRKIEIRFIHYDSFDNAREKWEERKSRVNFDNMFLIFTFMGDKGDEKNYDRAQNLPFSNKVIFVKNPVDSDKYPEFFKIDGFEKKDRIGTIGLYKNLFGCKYYDRFDFVRWINNVK